MISTDRMALNAKAFLIPALGLLFDALRAGRRRVLAPPLLGCLLVLLVALPARAQQPSPSQLGPALLQGTTTQGAAFDLRGQQGKVVLLVFWSTDCPVCRDKLPELRSNRAGWRKEPFEIVLVSTDRRLEDLKTYQGIAERLLLPEQRMTTLWSGAPSFRSNLPVPTRLPAAWLVDKQGRLVEAWEGRIPAEAWDRISELL